MTSFIIFLSFLPSFAWLILFLKKDVHPEPKKMIAKVFISGAFATILVFVVQFLLLDFLKFFDIGKNTVFSFLLLSITEEIFKFLAAYLVIRKSKFFIDKNEAENYLKDIIYDPVASNLKKEDIKYTSIIEIELVQHWPEKHTE